jgi:hypothetical protein
VKCCECDSRLVGGTIENDATKKKQKFEPILSERELEDFALLAYFKTLSKDDSKVTTWTGQLEKTLRFGVACLRVAGASHVWPKIEAGAVFSLQKVRLYQFHINFFLIKYINNIL